MCRSAVAGTHIDILFTPRIVTDVLQCSEDVALAVDTDWLVRYESRSDHPSDDAEKVTAENGRVTRIHREIPEVEAHGEYIGLAKFSAAGAEALRRHYHRCREQFDERPFEIEQMGVGAGHVS